MKFEEGVPKQKLEAPPRPARPDPAASRSKLATSLLRLFQDKLLRVPAEADVREDLHAVRKVVTAANNVRLDADRDERGHADRFWALALAHHAADDLKKPLPAPVARKPIGW